MKSVNGTDCEASCRANPNCPSWQNTPYISCWQGLGYDCFVRNNFQVRGAQRLQHGSVRVLMNLTGWQIIGLYKVFDNAAGFFINTQDAVTFCKNVCYSDIRCQYWTYAPNYGCWVQDASQNYGPSWPLTLESANRDTDYALDSVAGEYIQHFCPEDQIGRQAPTPPPTLSDCAERSVRYEPVDMVYQGRTRESSYEACRQRCINTINCAYFAYWPDGGCHITDIEAHKVVAENYDVIAGPKDCSGAYTSTTPGPGDWVIGTTPIRVYDQPTPSNNIATADAVHLAEIGTIIHNVDVSKLTTADLAKLKAEYAVALAKTLSTADQTILPTEIKEAPDGTGLVGQVHLVKESDTNSDMTAWTWNQPLNSPDGAAIEALLLTDGGLTYSNNMVQATYDVLGQGHPAILGEVTIGRPDVGTVVHPLSGASSAAPSWWSQWWPLVLAIIIVLCVSAGCIFFQMSERKDKNRLMNNIRDSSMDSDGEELGEASVWSSSPPEPQHVQQNYRGYQPQRYNNGEFAA